ncbi:hypothetical protein LVJ94_08470 [Pendulispora rubella]|uniref:LptF/LptG family permease n=1 Tax=Pendulispora rubella TaxID=2741070 RepID=A0ABZ2L8K5_9BACT
MVPLIRPAARDAVAFCLGIAVLALGAGAVRVLPWALDSTVPWAVALPFARSVAMLALEAAVLLGWPLGWALATHRFVAAGEARVFALLGETPVRTMVRLLPSGAAFACVLALLSFMGGRDARAPGRVLGELVAEGRASCVADPAAPPRAITIPFLRASWLCAPDREPRLLAPSPLGNLVVNAADARIAEDLRRIELEDARFTLGSDKSMAHVRAGAMEIRGLPPWAQSSKLPPLGRALLMVASAFAASALVVFLLLSERLRGRAAGLAVAASGPLAALGMLRALERQSGAGFLPFFLLPLAAVVAVLCSTWLAACLPRNGVTAST